MNVSVKRKMMALVDTYGGMVPYEWTKKFV